MFESDANFRTVIESFNCIECTGTIARENVHSNIPAKSAVTRRTVMAKCEHCNAVFANTYVLRGNVWCAEGDVTRVTDPAKLTKFEAQLAKRLGRVTDGARAAAAA